MLETIALGHLRLRPWEFLEYTLRELFNAHAGWQAEQENAERLTRQICFFSGNHKVSAPEDLWMLPSEAKKYERDILEGRVPFATVRVLTDEEIKNWKRSG